MPRSTLSIWPRILFTRFSSFTFSLSLCDMPCLLYPTGVYYPSLSARRMKCPTNGPFARRKEESANDPDDPADTTPQSIRDETRLSEPKSSRRWVETADERCPLACVWFALPEINAEQDDESEPRRPAFSLFRLKAGCLRSINIFPAPSILAQSLKNSIHTIAALLLLTISLVANAQEQEPDR